MPENFEKLKLKQLQKLCAENRLPKRGNKQDLVKILTEYFSREHITNYEDISDDVAEVSLGNVQIAEQQGESNPGIALTPSCGRTRTEKQLNYNINMTPYSVSERNIEIQQPYGVLTTTCPPSSLASRTDNFSNILSTTYSPPQVTMATHATNPVTTNSQQFSQYAAQVIPSHVPVTSSIVYQNQFLPGQLFSTVPVTYASYPYQQIMTPTVNMPVGTSSAPIVTTSTYPVSRSDGSYGSVRDIMEILPEFHPFEPNSLKSNQFVDKVNQLKAAYRWEDKAVLFAVHTKLKGPAKFWIDNVNVFHTWADFTEQFLRDFPCEFNIADIHLEMAENKQKSQETIEEFYYRLLAIGRKGNLPDAAIIKYILRGVRDRDFIRSASVTSFERCTDLLTTIKRYTSFNSFRQNETTKFQTRPVVNNLQKTKAEEILCYNCFKTGHIAIHCPEPSRRERCTICLRTNHRTADCPQEVKKFNNTNTNVNKISGEHMESSAPENIIKRVKIGSNEYEAFVDIGSSYTLIRNTLAKKIGSIDTVNINLIGFGGGSYHCKESTKLNIEIDNKLLKTTALVVDDGLLDSNLLLGKNILCDQGKRLIIENGSCWIENSTNLEVETELTRNKKNHRLYRREEKEIKFVVSKNARGKILKSCHDKAGHFELEKNIDRENRQEAAERIRKKQKKWKVRSDQKHQAPWKYNMGDLVVIENEPPATGESRKLPSKFEGPYIIRKVLHNDRYLIEDIDGFQVNKKKFSSIFAVDKIKSWCHSSPAVNDAVDDDEDESSNEIGDDFLSGKAELSDEENVVK